MKNLFIFLCAMIVSFLALSFSVKAQNPIVKDKVTVTGSIYDRSPKYNNYPASNRLSFIGVWRSGNSNYQIYTASAWGLFLKKWEEISNQGYRLNDLEIKNINGKNIYTGIFHPGKGKYTLLSIAGWDKFTKKWRVFSKKGYRLIDFETYWLKGRKYYAGVFLEGKGKSFLWRVSTWNALMQKATELHKRGYRLINIETDTHRGNRYFTGVWRSGTYANYNYKLNGWNAFVAKWKEMGKKNYVLSDVETYQENGKQIYLGVWVKKKEGYYLWQTNSWNKLTAKIDALKNSGLRLVDLEIIKNSSGSGISSTSAALGRGLPEGSYKKSCQNCYMVGNKLHAECRAKNGACIKSTLVIYPNCGRVTNDNGTLRCGILLGSYLKTCKYDRFDGTTLKAKCRRKNGTWNVNAALRIYPGCGRIWNDDGELRCAKDSKRTDPKPHYPAAKTICSTSSIPYGWMVQDRFWSPTSCGKPTNCSANKYKIIKYSDMAIGGTLEVCGDAGVPSGWEVVKRYRTGTKCNSCNKLGNGDNMMSIKRKQ